METLKNETPRGYDVESFDQKTVGIKFRKKPKKITRRIISFDDILTELKIGPSDFESGRYGLEKDEVA